MAYEDKNAPLAEKKYDTYGGDVKLQQATVNIKCSSCGSSMEFDAESGMMKCPSCNSYQEIEVNKTFEDNPFDDANDIKVDWKSETRIFKCKNCGAETVFDNTEFASECAFCGSPNVAATNEIEGIRPDVVLPFKLSVEKARDVYTRWIKKKFFAPKSFKTNLDLNRFKGVYTPCWLFDSDTFSRYKGRAGKYYYVTVGSGKNRRTERRIRWFPVSGTNSNKYKNVLVEASAHLTQKDIERLKPFPTDGYVTYDKRYLLGYTADHYNCGLNDSWKTAKTIIDTDIKNRIRSEILRRADVVEYINVETDYSNKKYKYALLPVFVGRVDFKSKNYNMYINGVTGRTTGSYPKSVGKILGVIFGSLLFVAAIAVTVALILY